MTALSAVAADLEAVAPDAVVIGGDLCANGASPAEVVDYIRDCNWPVVLGNTDEMLWRPELFKELLSRAPGRGNLRRVLFEHVAPYTAERLGPARLDWLRGRPTSWSANGVTVWHASPRDLWRAPLAAAGHDELKAVFGATGASVAVYGHIHHPFVRVLPEMTVVNTGSLSLSYDGDPRAAYAVIDDRGVTIRRVAYDVEIEVGRLRAIDYPYCDWLVQILRTAQYIPPR
jgi:hypothetical protein